MTPSIPVETFPTPSTPMTLMITHSMILNVKDNAAETPSDMIPIAVMNISCPLGQIPVNFECTPTFCLQSYFNHGGKCNLEGLTISSNSTNCSDLVTLKDESLFEDLENDTILLRESQSVVKLLIMMILDIL